MTRRLAAMSATFAMLLGGLSAGTIAAAPAALAYQGCNSQASGSANPTAADGGQPIDFTVTFRDCNGLAQAGVLVTFSQGSSPAGCTAKFSPTTARTDANGVAHTTVTLPSGCPCQFTLNATGNGVTVTTTVRENGCLPFTAATERVAAAVPDSPLVLVLAVLGLVLATCAGVYLVRTRAS